MSAGNTARRNTAHRMQFQDTVGRMVRGFRVAAGLSIRELADQAGSTTSTISNIEHGQGVCPLYLAARIAEAVDCSLDDLAPVLLDHDEEESAAE